VHITTTAAAAASGLDRKRSDLLTRIKNLIGTVFGR